MVKILEFFQDTPATVEYVKGEFYWRVEQGERVRAVDFVAPPLMLSQEVTDKEVNWSLGTYLTNKEVEKAFEVKGLPKPWNVAPESAIYGRILYKSRICFNCAFFGCVIFYERNWWA